MKNLIMILTAATVVMYASRANADGVARDLEQQLTDIVDRVTPSVVAVSSVREHPGQPGETSRCEGTGVILRDGIIATTLGVAGPSDRITIRYANNRRTPAHVIAVDPMRELSLLRAESSGGEPIRVGNADSLHAGSWLFVVGFSLASPEANFATGRFSSRTILNLNDSTPDRIELLQLEANVYPGNSGAAVIDADGRLVGIILGGLASNGAIDPVVLSTFSDRPDPIQSIVMADRPLGISFALPGREVEALASAIGDGEPEPPGYLGIRVEMAEDVGEGVLVSEVFLGGPAARAGIRAGDVITELDDRPVPDTMALVNLVREFEPGTRARLQYVSSAGEVRTTQVVLGDYTADYRVRLIWQRLLTGRASDLTDARARLQQQLDLLDEELNRVRTLAPAGYAGPVNDDR